MRLAFNIMPVWSCKGYHTGVVRTQAAACGGLKTRHAFLVIKKAAPKETALFLFIWSCAIPMPHGWVDAYSFPLL